MTERTMCWAPAPAPASAARALATTWPICAAMFSEPASMPSRFSGLPGQVRVAGFDDGDVVRWRVLHIASHGGCGCQDVDVVAQTGDLPVARGEHNDVGKRELAGGCAGPEGFLLDDDRFRIVGVVDGKSTVTLILQRVGLPPCGYPVHDFVPAVKPGRHAWACERELMDRVDCVHTAHVIGGLADSGLAETLQNLTRTSFLLAECRSLGSHLAVADLPAVGLARDDVVVGDAAGRSVGLDADSFGLGPRLAIVDPSDHDVGDVMTGRAGFAQCERGLTHGRGPVQRAEAEVVQVIGDIWGE